MSRFDLFLRIHICDWLTLVVRVHLELQQQRKRLVAVLKLLLAWMEVKKNLGMQVLRWTRQPELSHEECHVVLLIELEAWLHVVPDELELACKHTADHKRI